MTAILAQFLKAKSGTTAVEYALICSLIGLAAITAMKAIGSDLSAKLTQIATSMTS